MTVGLCYTAAQPSDGHTRTVNSHLDVCFMSLVQRANQSENEEQVRGLSLSDGPETNRKCGSEILG